MQTVVNRYRHAGCFIEGEAASAFSRKYAPVQLSLGYSISATLENNWMNLEIWLPAMFLLGVTTFGLCLWFVNLCEKI